MPTPIVTAPRQDAALLAGIIRKSHRSVAEKFNLTPENCPSHPSLCQADWVEQGMDRGEVYYLYQLKGEPVGCVAFAMPEKEQGIGFLNRLSVLPRHRRQGIGKDLVTHVLDRAKQEGLSQVTIGIIEPYTRLKDWYIKQGFILGEKKAFAHLPFEVRYLAYNLV